jgi:Protein of unknown function (DUF3592)
MTHQMPLLTTLPLEDPGNILKLTLCGVAAVCLPIVTFIQFLKTWRNYRSAQSWEVAHGVILESVIYMDVARKAENFRIRYEFDVGERIEGNTPRASGDFFYTDGIQREFVNRYRSGQAIAVYYHPLNPRKNCIDRTDGSGVVAKAGMFLITLFISGVLGWGIFKLLTSM